MPAVDAARSGAVDPDVPPIESLVAADAEAPLRDEGAIRSGKLAGKSLWSAIFILAMPVLFQQFMAACVGLIDKILAGNLPKQIVVPALDAIGIGSYVGWLIGIAMAGLGIGGQAVIARGIGAGDLGQSGRALGQAVSLSIIWGTLVGMVMWLAAEPLARMCQLSDEATVYCTQYVRVIAYAMPCTGVMFVGAMCMHGAGETTRPSLIAVIVNVVNVGFAWMLSGVEIDYGGHVLKNPFPFDLNVIGIASGTAISYLAGAAMTVAVLIRGVKDLRLEARHMVPDLSMTRRIVRIGVPNFLEGMAMWGVNLVVLVFIGQIARRAMENGTSEGLQGAHIIAVQWEALSFLPGLAMGTAAGALAGQFLGAGNPGMARKSIIACTIVGCAVMGLLGVLFMTCGRLLTSIISSEAVHMDHTPNLLFIAGTIQIFFAIAMVIRYGLRGAGDAIWPFVITTISSYAVRLPLAWVLGIAMGLGIEGIWMGLCGEIVVRAALFAVRFGRGGWTKLKV
jgi:putative MATE family efflux protein